MGREVRRHGRRVQVLYAMIGCLRDIRLGLYFGGGGNQSRGLRDELLLFVSVYVYRWRRRFGRGLYGLSEGGFVG